MIIKIKDWRIVEHAPDSGKEPEFSVIIADQEVSTRPIIVKVPYTGMTDTTISEATHDLFIDPAFLRSNTPKTGKDNIFFRKQSRTEQGGVIKSSSFHNTPASVVFGDKIGKQRKAIIDQSTGASLTVGPDAVAMGAPGQELIAGEKGVTMTSGSPTVMDLPAEDHILIKETGLLRFLPKCFLPPFAIPDYIPNLQFMAQIAGTVAIFKEIRKLTERGL